MAQNFPASLDVRRGKWVTFPLFSLEQVPVCLFAFPTISRQICIHAQHFCFCFSVLVSQMKIWTVTATIRFTKAIDSLKKMLLAPVTRFAELLIHFHPVSEIIPFWNHTNCPQSDGKVIGEGGKVAILQWSNLCNFVQQNIKLASESIWTWQISHFTSAFMTKVIGANLPSEMGPEIFHAGHLSGRPWKTSRQEAARWTSRTLSDSYQNQKVFTSLDL